MVMVFVQFKDLTGNISPAVMSNMPSYTKTQAPAGIFVPLSSLATSYTVTWSASPTASLTTGVTYVLQEATLPDFSRGLRTAYTGSALAANITSRTKGAIYYYRVQAKKSGYETSTWTTGANGCSVGP